MFLLIEHDSAIKKADGLLRAIRIQRAENNWKDTAMRILVTGMPRTMGGIGTLLFNIAGCNDLQDQREKVIFDFLTPEGSQCIDQLQKKQYDYYECPPIWRVFSYYKVVRSCFSEKNYNYVWINNTSKIDIVLPLVAKYKGKARIIQHSHGVDSEERGLKKFIFSLLQRLYGKQYERLIDIPLACSEASADYFYQNESLRNRCKVLGNGIFTDRFQFNPCKREEIRREMNIEKDDIFIGTVGRLTGVKNYPFLPLLIRFQF